MLRRNNIQYSAAIAALFLSGGIACLGQYTIRYYRYDLQTRIGDHQYADQIPAATSRTGQAYKMERDRLGRKVSLTSLSEGKTTLTWKYHYPGSERLPDGYETWLNGERTESTKMTRDASGTIVRYDHFTAQGDLAWYTKRQDQGDRVEEFAYDAKEKPTNHYVSWFAPSGFLIRRITYASGADQTVYTETTIDEHTGQTLSAKQMDNQQLVNTKKWVWSADGEIERVDVYDNKGVWYSADEFENGLRTRRLYKFTDTGKSKEIRYTYDDKRWMTKAEVYYDGHFVCTLTYNLLSDGAVKSTLAVAPDGSLMAEYPAPAVTDIERNGQPPGRNDGVLHKTGNWW